MQRMIALAVMLMFSALLSAGQVTAERPKGEDKGNEEMIRSLHSQEVEALMHKDVGALRQIMSDDFVVTNPFNQFLNKQQVLDRVDAESIAFSSYDRKLEYIKFYGDTAIAAGTESIVPAKQMPGAGRTMNLRFTTMWVKQGGRWQEVARQASIVQPPQPQAPAK
jgi:ketosteroid isomerase-like protein